MLVQARPSLLCDIRAVQLHRGRGIEWLFQLDHVSSAMPAHNGNNQSLSLPHLHLEPVVVASRSGSRLSLWHCFPSAIHPLVPLTAFAVQPRHAHPLIISSTGFIVSRGCSTSQARFSHSTASMPSLFQLVSALFRLAMMRQPADFIIRSVSSYRSLAATHDL